ncbi:MAG TPA: hypothetical protein VK838_02980 [Candidatus Limnocylindrales bacterium]|nr:hypothetical protein [Candidatus Limnocylindrales bacterium]
MTFWNWRRGTSPTSTSGTAAMAMNTELAPIELYTAEARIVGWIAADGHRVTDLLNERDELRLWHPTPGPIEGPGSKNAPPPNLDDNGEWQELLTELVLLAMPPEWRASRQLRLHRKLRRVAVAAPPFTVTGNVHLPPGAQPGSEYMFRRQRFMPLTEAHILHDGEPPFEHVVSVVIVNTVHVTEMVPLVTLA